MLDQIINHEILFPLRRCGCEENGICISFCNELMVGSQINDEIVLILKIDDYYSSSRMHNPPQSIDCLIIVKTNESEYGFALVELRDVKGSKLIKPTEIEGKFKTVVNRFLQEEFSSIFLQETYSLSWLKLWLVTNPYRWPPMSNDEYRRKIKGTVLDAYQSIKPFRFKNKVAMITPMPPDATLCLDSP